MSEPENELFDFLDDLEAHASSVAHRERMDEVSDRSRSAYHEVSLESRLMASVGHDLRLEVLGLGLLTGTLERVGTGWCRMGRPGASWVVRTAAVVRVRNASPRAVPPVAWRAVDRLGHGAVLRRLADERRSVHFHLDNGATLAGTVLRVGGDFVEVRLASGEVELVATGRVAAHRED